MYYLCFITWSIKSLYLLICNILGFFYFRNYRKVRLKLYTISVSSFAVGENHTSFIYFYISSLQNFRRNLIISLDDACCQIREDAEQNFFVESFCLEQSYHYTSSKSSGGIVVARNGFWLLKNNAINIVFITNDIKKNK